MKFVTVLILSLIAGTASAGPVYDLVPSSLTSNVNGLDFSSGFVLTNTLAHPSGETGDRFVDLAVAFDHVDGGNVVYRPDNVLWQLYVLDRTIPATTATILAEGLFTGSPIAVDLGAGRHQFLGDLIVATSLPNVFDRPGHVEIVFDTTLPLGHQVVSGSIAIGSVPEPASLCLVGAGLVIAGLARGRLPV